MTGGGGAAGAIDGELTVVVVAESCVPASKRGGAAGVAAGRMADDGAAGAEGCGSILGATLVPPRLPNIFDPYANNYEALPRSLASKGERKSRFGAFATARPVMDFARFTNTSAIL